ncbi:hypothetical protein [Polaromonas sp. AER18D-145]|uniref:hypothetical protein n=1 Tax=Polaromonas sp. AER18D-145 TaxID=1977060 RepID=UPI000BBC9D1A|nr:hypothetical protein [Polaromonas sp. AER18D-145]
MSPHPLLYSRQALDLRQVLQASLRPVSATAAARPSLIVAGATGALGSEVLRRLAGSDGFAHTHVLAHEPMSTGLAQVSIAAVRGEDIAAWPVRPLQVQTGVVMFEPPRLYHDRERALWTPQLAQLPALAQWLRRCGVQTLVLVLPHAPGRLPQALRHGLVSVDEQQVAALGFERVLLVRSAQQQPRAPGGSLPGKVAAWMLSTFKYMIPAAAQPVRPARLAEFVEVVLRVLPAGIHVVAPELLWQAVQAPHMQDVVRAWLNTGQDCPAD